MTRRFRPRLAPLDPRVCLAVFGNPWPNPNLTLSFTPDGTDVDGQPSRLTATLADIPEAARQREILRAFETWVAAANVNVGLVPDGGQPIGTAGPTQGDRRFGDIRVAAVPVASDAVALGMPFDVTAGTRAGDVWLNSAQRFGTAGGPGLDLYSVALHEAGHVFGLPGSDDPASAMYQVAGTRTGLSSADVAALTALYGPRQPDAFEGPAGNETLATAARIQPQGGQGPSQVILATADLTTAGDVDAYTFRPNNLRGLGMTVTAHAAGFSLLVPRLEVLGANGAVIASGVGAGPGAGDVSLHLPAAVEGATYYARVTGADPAFAVGGYTLEVRPDATPAAPVASGALPNPDTGDNNTLGRATQLDQKFLQAGPRFDYAISGGLNTTADVDFYRLKSPQSDTDSAGTLTATVWAAGAGTDPVLDVFDKDGKPVAATVVVHDGGTYTVQVPNAVANEDYYVAVRHDRLTPAVPGGYSLGVDFGGPTVGLQPLAGGTLTAAAPINTASLTVAPSQVLHLLLAVDPGTAAGARVSVLAADGRLVGSRLALAGDTASVNLFLAAGSYQLLVAGGATDGSPFTGLRYTVQGLSVSDPIGPRAAAADAAPPASPPPPVVSTGPPAPLTPVGAVQPTPPGWLLFPPTDWPAAPAATLRPAPKPPARTFSAGGPDGAVRAFNPDGSDRFSVTPFDGWTGTVRVAEADFNGDGVADLLAGTGPGGPPRVRLLDGLNRRELFAFSPFESAFTGGVFVAAGDVTGDGIPDLVVTPDQGGGPRVRVFSGKDFGPVADFFGIDDTAFRGGARAAVGDVNADGVADLLVSAGFGGGPRVAGFDGRTVGSPVPAKLFADFFAFEDTLRNGVYLAAGDFDGDGRADLTAGAGPGGGPRVSGFDAGSLLANAPARGLDLFAGDPADRGGVPVAVKDLDGDGKTDLVAGSGTGSQVIGYSGRSAAKLLALDPFPGEGGGVYVG